MHTANIELLEHTGVEVQHDEALALLYKAGARVDGTRVRIPRALVDDALFAAPRSISMASRSDASGITLEAGPIYYGTGSECLYVLGPGARERRPISLADVEEMAVLQEKLPAIDFVMSMAHPHELDAQFAPVAQFAAMLRHVQAGDHGCRRPTPTSRSSRRWPRCAAPPTAGRSTRCPRRRSSMAITPLSA